MSARLASVAPSRIEVCHGFEAAVGAAERLLDRAHSLSAMLPGEILDEFATLYLDSCRRVVVAGGSVRVLSLGAAAPAVARELAGAGAVLRVLDEVREVGLLASERGMILFPTEQQPDSPLMECVIATDDVLARAHFQLAFDRAWARARPRGGLAGNVPLAGRDAGM
jgi:hypothetical protein